MSDPGPQNYDDGDYWVTVCGACLTASCWHGEFMCSNACSAGTRDVPSHELRLLGLEHPGNYSRDRLMEVCGEVREHEREGPLV